MIFKYLTRLSLRRLFWPITRRLRGCCLLLLLAGLLACAAFGYVVHLALAQTAAQTPTASLLLIDNSNSMFEKGSIGSDPQKLRIQAAHLFITYLGVDSSGPMHRLGVIFFGGQAHLAVPLTPLTDDERRAEIMALINNPEPLRWTNPQAALELAEAVFQTASLNSTTRRAVILLTDGKPEWTTTPTTTETTQTIARLRAVAGRFTAQGTPLFIILLQNSATDADPEIAELYEPLWQELATAAPPGRFYRARRSEELLDIYHDIVVTLTGRQTAGVVVQTAVQTETVEAIQVEPNLLQITFVIRKSDPALQVQLLRPDGRPLSPDAVGVQYAGRAGQSREEIWAVNRPQAGRWQVWINGQGEVTVWKDFYRPSATPTAPSPTATPLSTATATSVPSPTVTPLPTATTSPPSTVTPSPSITPIPLSTVTAATTGLPTPRPNPTANVLLWLALPLTILSVSGAGWYYWYRQVQQRPLLSGVLRQVAAPSWAVTPAITRLDLDALRQRTLILGATPNAGVSLPAAPSEEPAASIQLVARYDAENCPAVVLVPLNTGSAAAIEINRTALTNERYLRDGDLITLGQYRFRYENLRQRNAGFQGRPK